MCPQQVLVRQIIRVARSSGDVVLGNSQVIKTRFLIHYRIQVIVNIELDPPINSPTFLHQILFDSPFDNVQRMPSLQMKSSPHLAHNRLWSVLCRMRLRHEVVDTLGVLDTRVFAVQHQISATNASHPSEGYAPVHGTEPSQPESMHAELIFAFLITSDHSHRRRSPPTLSSKSPGVDLSVGLSQPKVDPGVIRTE